MILIKFERSSIPLGPYSLLAHFPIGRERLTTQALVRHLLSASTPFTYGYISFQVGMTAAVRRDGRVNLAPKVYDYIDYKPNPIGAEVVLLEKVWNFASLPRSPVSTPLPFRTCSRSKGSRWRSYGIYYPHCEDPEYATGSRNFSSACSTTEARSSAPI